MSHEYQYLEVRINYRELATRLKSFRREYQLTQDEVGQLLGINGKVVANIERCALRRNAGKDGVYGNGVHLEMKNFLALVNLLYHDKPVDEIVTIFEVV